MNQQRTEMGVVMGVGDTGDEMVRVGGLYRVEANGEVVLTSHGDNARLSCWGEDGQVTLEGDTTVSCIAGPAMVLVTDQGELVEEGMGSVVVTGGLAGEINLVVGPEETPTMINMIDGVLTISLGPEGAGSSIIMTPESITFKVGEIVVMITPEGIVETVAEATRAVTPEGHNFTAAETEVNFGVEGVTTSAPLKGETIEGGVTDNSSLSSESIEGVDSHESTMTMDS